MDTTDIMNFYKHHINEEGKLCLATLKEISAQIAELFTKMDITVEQAISDIKEIFSKLGPIIQHCPKMGIDY